MKYPKHKRWLAPVILITGLIIAVLLMASKEDELPSALLSKPLTVEVIKAQRSTTQLDVPAWGLVEPREQVDIRPQVEGSIVSVSDHIVAGAAIKQRDVLFIIDPRDFENRLAEAEATYEQARQALEIEKGQQKIARAEYKLLQQNDSTITSNALALRQPQLKEREAALSMAKAQLQQAELDLERTTLKAPCDGQIMKENIAAGQYAENGTIALSVACTESYHITASFPSDYSVDATKQKAVVTINDKAYPATLKAVLPQIDPDTRQKQALVSVSDVVLPLGYYAAVTLPGLEFQNVIPLPKAALRANNTVWILTADNTLDIRSVTLAAQNDERIFVVSGLEDGVQVILSHIASPLKGMELRLPETEQKQDDAL
ncbi:efflux RND transporter periplasmic adaptor subunit [Emcibacter sp.]|uniref:efflux RND transporter periplasmic adaptor subunit n=1 Tax=Emcibacter sp. TaxID=1979954 RepID=UPI003A94A870